MALKTDGQCRCALRVAGFGVVLLVGICLGGTVLGVRINTSRSLPIGVYITTTEPTAGLIEFCPKGAFARESSERGYRSRGVACKDGAVPLLKPIVAREGDIVEANANGISVNGVLLPRTAPLRLDAHERQLVPWPFGVYRVAPGTVWVASVYHPGSYDSRYMGPIGTSQVRTRLRPLWTF